MSESVRERSSEQVFAFGAVLPLDFYLCAALGAKPRDEHLRPDIAGILCRYIGRVLGLAHQSGLIGQGV